MRSRKLITPLLAALALLALPAPSALASSVTFQYVVPSDGATGIASANVSVFPVPDPTPGSYSIVVTGPGGVALGNPVPATFDGTFAKAQSVAMRVGDTVELVNGTTTVARDTFDGPLVGSDACAGSKSFTGTSLAGSAPTVFLNQGAQPLAGTTYTSPTFTQPLTEPLAIGDTIAATTSWTDPDGTSGTASEDVTVNSTCPAGGTGSGVGTGTGTSTGTGTGTSTGTTLPLDHIALTITAGPMASSAADGSAPVTISVILPKGVPTSVLPADNAYELIVTTPGGQASVFPPHYAEFGTPFSVTTGALLPGARIELLRVDGSGIDALREPLFIVTWNGAAIDEGGCFHSTEVAGPAPGAGNVTLTEDGKPALVLLNDTATGTRFSTVLPSQWDGGPLTLTTDYPSSTLADGLDLSVHATYTLQNTDVATSGGAICGTVFGGTFTPFTPSQTVVRSTATAAQTTSHQTSTGGWFSHMLNGSPSTTTIPTPPGLGQFLVDIAPANYDLPTFFELLGCQFYPTETPLATCQELNRTFHVFADSAARAPLATAAAKVTVVGKSVRLVWKLNPRLAKVMERLRRRARGKLAARFSHLTLRARVTVRFTPTAKGLPTVTKTISAKIPVGPPKHKRRS
ncbi:MAG TPA: hypothetical protein VMP89_04315 [Solirubrobacteraceae bacterium]|nr:hypothetical protein [Solirubrobacteraceae bacterium]